jgi:hypothetical protein
MSTTAIEQHGRQNVKVLISGQFHDPNFARSQQTDDDPNMWSCCQTISPLDLSTINPSASYIVVGKNFGFSYLAPQLMKKMNFTKQFVL